MGSYLSSTHVVESTHNTEKGLKVYMPSTFPIDPIVDNDIVRLCAISWERHVLEKDKPGTEGEVFCSLFYKRLEKIDQTGMLNGVILMHCPGGKSGTSKIALKAKRAILLRMINYAIQIDAESSESFVKMTRLVTLHHKKFVIRPELYSLFIENIIETLALFIKDDDLYYLDEWRILFAYILKTFLIYSLQNDQEEDLTIGLGRNSSMTKHLSDNDRESL